MKKTIIGLFVAVLIFSMISSAHADVINLYSAADAEITGWITGGFANTHNWGGLNWLTGNVSQTGGPTSTQFGNTGDSRGLLKFDLSSIPTGATIDSASLYLYVGWNAFSPISSRITSVSLYQVTSDWTEMGVTYDTRPTWNTTAATSMSIPAGTGSGGSIPFNGYITGNVTSLVQDWFDGDITNFGLVTSDTYTTAGLLRIYAHEANGTSTDPKLTVTYTLPPPPPVATPEPATMLLLGLGLIGLAGVKRKFKK